MTQKNAVLIYLAEEAWNFAVTASVSGYFLTYIRDNTRPVKGCTMLLMKVLITTCFVLNSLSYNWNLHLTEYILHKYSGVCYNERCYNEQFLSIILGCYNARGGILSADVARAFAWSVGPSRFD
jgi:hypothetical protein